MQSAALVYYRGLWAGIPPTVPRCGGLGLMVHIVVVIAFCRKQYVAATDKAHKARWGVIDFRGFHLPAVPSAPPPGTAMYLPLWGWGGA